ncbi:hypothetical protein CS022_19130 [Veronia nyctiphanis]|uniref:AB hydrolase-1 domain-containing protein n=1 Tax=Veronia nyctiphanis TaxID=1278244 RepID=A0A4Q0YSG7_9GAMM|nr:hypothetical protein CS022_19130 [Veronia nyctiphanis]
MPIFSDDYHTLSLDFPFHGKSGGDPTQFSVRHCADVAIALLDELNIKKCYVIGISMGGMAGF